MKISFTIFALFGLLALSAGSAAAQNEPPPIVKKAQVFTITEAKTFDYGTVENKVYTNKFLGIRFSLPENWEVQPREFGDAVRENGGNLIKGKSVEMQKKIDETQTTTKVLLSLKNGVGGNGTGTFMFTAESIGQNSAFITSGADYLRASLNGFRQSVLPPGYEVSYEIKQDKLGSNTIPYFETKTAMVKQRFYGITRKGYGILFLMTYVEETELETMREIVKNADLAFK